MINASTHTLAFTDDNSFDIFLIRKAVACDNGKLKTTPPRIVIERDGHNIIDLSESAFNDFVDLCNEVYTHTDTYLHLMDDETEGID